MSKTTIVIISKSGSLSECQVEPNKETTIEELTILLSKKCGYRNHDGFRCYHTWRYKNKHKNNIDSKYLYVDIWGKTDGRAGNENKYELPPPIDELLFFGNLALVARMDKENAVNLTIDLWTKIYEKLFGGFEDLTSTATVLEDENESDELASIPASMKTHNGYLKDGFIVEDDSEDTPRVKPKKRNNGRKHKSESTESEFITETDTDSGTIPSSDSPVGSDADADADVVAPRKLTTKRNANASTVTGTSSNGIQSKPKRTIKKQPSGSKSKKTASTASTATAASAASAAAEEGNRDEIESELSEEPYD